jgi:hypothetical protein
MSTRIMADCWPLQLPPTPKAVLISLADQANDQGFCWPSVATLCERTCFGERAVRNAIRWLEKVGLLKVEIGAMKANRYTVRARQFLSEEAQKLLPPRHEMPPGTTCPPARDAGQGGTTCPLTVIEPNSIPPNPPLPMATGGELAPTDPKPKRPVGKLLSLQQWLDACKVDGVMPIPEDDPVHAYCASVGIEHEILALHWAEFKLRRGESTKRQADWRQTFRNSVRSNWFRLWFIGAGQPATLTTTGRQAMAWHARVIA